jgi:hypothetical protein
MASAINETETFEFGSILISSFDRAARGTKNIWLAKQIFRPSTRGFFTFTDGQMHYAADPGTDVSLYVDKYFFPQGLSLISIELLNFSKEVVDWSFELIVERVDGGVSCLGLFDLIQLKRRIFSNQTKIFSGISRLRFNNLDAVNRTAFSIGLLVLG